LEFHECRIMASCLKQCPLKEVDVATSDEHSVDSVHLHESAAKDRASASSVQN